MYSNEAEVYPRPLPNIGLCRQAQIIQRQIAERQAIQSMPNVPFFNDFISLNTINDNYLYYSFMLDQNALGYSFDTAENNFIESFFTKTDIVKCDICYNEEIDLDFVRHCRGGYHVSCLKNWVKTNAICPRCRQDCDSNPTLETEEKEAN